MSLQEVRHWGRIIGQRRVVPPDLRVMGGALGLMRDAIVDAKAVKAVLEPVERRPEEPVDGDRQSMRKDTPCEDASGV